MVKSTETAVVGTRVNEETGVQAPVVEASFREAVIIGTTVSEETGIEAPVIETGLEAPFIERERG